MRKRQLYMVELERNKPNTELNKNTDLIKNIQTAALLSLLEDKLIAKWQFDRCINELNRSCYSHIGRTEIDEV